MFFKSDAYCSAGLSNMYLITCIAFQFIYTVVVSWLSHWWVRGEGVGSSFLTHNGRS